MHLTPPILSARRLTRLHAWAGLMLAWIGMMLFDDRPRRPNRRHIRRRYRLLDLQAMARVIAKLILLRAFAMIPRRRHALRKRRDFTPSGFHRRLHPRQLVRSAIGARLRRQLRHRDLRTRLAILADALRNYEAYATQMALRLRRFLTRLAPVIATAPHADTVRTLAPAHNPCAADTS